MSEHGTFSYDEVVSIIVSMRDWIDCDDEKEGNDWITAYLTRRIREDNAKLDKARREDASRNPKTKSKK